MISPRLLRRRIRSVQSTAKITRAMEMIATAKMKRSQDQALAGRPYSDKITQVIADIAAQSDVGATLHPLLAIRDVKRIAIVHITSSRGLCGGLNTNINRSTSNFILEQKLPTTMVCVGRKGFDFMRRYGREIRAEFSKLGDYPKLFDTLPISRIIIDDYTAGLVDAAYVSYTRFVSTLTQKPVVEPILPVEPALIPRAENVEYIYEPDAQEVLAGLLPRFVEMQVYHAVLESIASEQSARMVAMRNATDNAKELVDELTLAYNKARQEAITTELLDITGGVSALSAEG